MAGTERDFVIFEGEYAALPDAAAKFAAAVEEFLGRYISAIRLIYDGEAITGAKTRENIGLFKECVERMAGRAPEDVGQFADHVGEYVRKIDKADKWVY